MNIRVGDESNQLELSDQDGHIVALRYLGEDLLLESSTAFTLRLLEVETGDYHLLTSADFADYSYSYGLCRWKNSSGYGDLTVECRIHFDGRFFRFRPAVRKVPAEFWVDLIEMPQVTVRKEDELFWSNNDGCLVCDSWRSNPALNRIGFPNGHVNLYPGSCKAQFFAAWGEKNGVYFAADDHSHSTKTLELNADGEGRTRLRLECTWGEDGTASEAELSFDLLLGSFQGGWMDACEIYREWMKGDPLIKGCEKQPKWFKESPVVVVYPVCGNGKISAEPNRFQPYDRAFPRIKELSEAIGSPILVHLMRWDQNGPWLPPYHWPPVGDVDSFFRFRDQLHEAGHYLGVYGSGTSYTRKSKINDYSDEEHFQSERLDRYMARGPKGEIQATICSDLREGADMCISEKWCRDILRKQVRQIAENSIDLYQIMDQNQGAGSFLCYSREHDHPPLPGRWQTDVMVQFLDEMNDEISRAGSDMVICSENSAAPPYMAALPFNDVRSPARYGKPVPSNAFLYHRFSNNFLGNQVGAWEKIDCVACPDNLQFRLAEGFVRGEFLSLSLRDSGEIDWGAASDWGAPAPRQEPVLKLVKILNRMRRSYEKFLAEGEMQKPFAEIKCGEYTLNLFRGDECYPALSSATWQAPDGTVAQFLVNFREQKETAVINAPSPCKLVLDSVETEQDGRFMLEMPPLSVAVILVNQKD